MNILVENTSSPGASFTSNTNSVILKTYDWILMNPGKNIQFYDFRMALQKDMGINDNNNRNIYPLLKNGGLVSYEKGKILNVDCFFTNNGYAYVKTLKTIEEIYKDGTISDSIRQLTLDRLNIISSNIIYQALSKIVHNENLSYVSAFRNYMKYLLSYGSIDKYEYAFLLYMLKDKDIDIALEEMNETITAYREGSLSFKVEVVVRNDNDIAEKTKTSHRKESLGFLTSFTYFTSLLQQAGLLVKNEKSYYIVKSKSDSLKQLVEE